MTTDLKMNVHLAERVSVLEFSGDVTGLGEGQIYEAYEKVIGNKCPHIILNFGHTEYISSSGIAVIINLLKRSGENKQKIYITRLSPHYQKIFQMVGVSRYVQTFATDEEVMTLVVS